MSTPAATVNQTGTAAIPASAEVTTARHTVPLPSGSELTFNEKLGTFSLRLSRDSTLTAETHAEHVTAPQSFAPPAPPTPADEAKGFGVRAFWVGALVCFAVAGVALWAEHPLAAGCIGLAGICLPVLAAVVTSTAALVVAVGLVAAGAAVWVVWHVLDARHGLEAGKAAADLASTPPAAPAR